MSCWSEEPNSDHLTRWTEAASADEHHRPYAVTALNFPLIDSRCLTAAIHLLVCPVIGGTLVVGKGMAPRAKIMENSWSDG